MHDAPRTRPTFDALRQLDLHDHACAIASESHRPTDLIARYLQFGLNRNDRAVYLFDEETRGPVLTSLMRLGVNVSAAIEAGALRLTPAREAYLQGGRFESSAVLAKIDAAVDETLADGYRGMSIIGELSWFEGQVASLDTYESTVNRVFDARPACGLCVYYRERISAKMLRRLLCVHPTVIADGTTSRNIYYIPPDLCAVHHNDERRVDHMLQSLVGYSRAERALSESQDILQGAMDAMPANAAVLDQNGTIIAVNARWREFADANELGWDDYGVNRSYLDVCRKAREPGRADAVQVLAKLEEILEGNRDAFAQEYPCHSPREKRWFVLNANRFFGNGRVMVTHISVTERKQAERALVEQRRQLDRILETVPDLIYIYDLNPPRIAYTNRAARRFFGLDLHEMNPTVPGQMKGIIHPDDEADLHRHIEKLLATPERMCEFEFRVKRADGDYRILHSRDVVFSKDAAGRPTQIMGVATDVTDLRRADRQLRRYSESLEELVRERTEELRQSQERLRQAERLASLGTLAAGIAHEINNPIGTILLTAEMGLRGGDPDGGRLSNEQFFRDIAADARRCAMIVRGILQFARQETTTKWEVDLNQLAVRTANLVRRDVEQAGGTITVTRHDGMLFVWANPIQIEQAILNLAKNAMEAARGPASIRLELSASDTMAQVRVIDAGVGIPESQLPHLFDPFHTSRQQEGGTGLGLSVSHGIVTEHGGTISVESEPGHTVFLIKLPLHDNPEGK